MRGGGGGAEGAAAPASIFFYDQYSGFLYFPLFFTSDVKIFIRIYFLCNFYMDFCNICVCFLYCTRSVETLYMVQ